jgi:DNA uptake protein ComE-like DNA-binding protein
MEKAIANLSLVKPLRNQGFFAVVDHLTKTPGINQGTVERLPHHGNPS